MPQIDLYPALDFSFSRLRDEEKLLISLSRMEMPDSVRARAASLIRERALDWDYFLELARVYRVIPFIYRHLQSLDVDIPDRIKQELREGAGLIFARNINALADIKLCTELFRKEGIEVLFIKGVPFMFDVYRDAGLRSFTDIDILVKAKDFRRTDKALKEKGFRLYENRGIFNHYRAQKMYSLDERVYLDVHMDLIGRRLHNRLLGIDKKKVWEDRREVCLRGVRIHTLDIVHGLLYHCMHVSIQHGFLGLIWYVDINEFMNRYGGGMDWDRVLDLARSYGIRRPLYYSLRFTKEMFGTPVPGYVMERLGRIERKLDRRVFTKIKANNAGTDYLAELVLFDRMRDTIKFVLLCFVLYPYLFAHFLSISGKVFRALFVRVRSEP